MKILLIRREGVCYSSLDSFLEGIKYGLETKGVITDILDVSSNPLIQPDETVLNSIAAEGYDAALTFNAVGQQNYSLNGGNFWDSNGIRFINYIVDHPLQHDAALSEHCTDYVVICVDRTHADFIRKYYPDIKENAFFIPVGGIKSSMTDHKDCEIDDFIQRKTDILFTGTYIPLHRIEDKINEYPPAVRRLIIRHIEYMLENRSKPEEEGLISVLEDMGIEPAGVDLKGYLIATRLTEEYVRAYIREEIMRYLIDSGLHIDIYGNGWDLFDGDVKNTVIYPGVPYGKIREMYSDSKIVLDQSSHFRYGMHDRIPSAMLSGAGVLTGRNGYLQTVFKEGIKEGELCMYDNSKPQNVPEIAYEMIEDPDDLYRMSLRGKAKAYDSLTWEYRAKELIEILCSISV